MSTEPCCATVRSVTEPTDRGVYCNRTLNLRAIRAIGYDMDYTLVHYDDEAWERRAFDHLRQRLADAGWPVARLRFDPSLAMLGLVIDRELGNLVKANRFGYVKAAAHGTRMMPFEAQREAYVRTIVDLSERRYVSLNSLFHISEASAYAQLVDLLDAGALTGPMAYDDLHDRVRDTMDEAHLVGELKAEIMSDPERYVVLDPETPRTLLDQRAAGKRLLLVTNSDWQYTRFMMSYAFDRFLPDGMGWRELFDLVLVSARKPGFFGDATPAFRIVDEAGLLAPSPAGMEPGEAYVAGNAELVEACLGVSGADILYVGDHIYDDVHVTKNVRRWRTALILRSLEHEIAAITGFRSDQERLSALMSEKERLEDDINQVRLRHARSRERRVASTRDDVDTDERRPETAALRARIGQLDERIAPIARRYGELGSARWGLLMRAGSDKSYLARQVERHADVYTSRVSNFAARTPYAFYRSRPGTLAHDPA